MKKTFTLLAVAFAGLMAESAEAQTLLHYWNFNNSATEQTLLVPTS